jgi:hypothetical protein
LGDDWKRIQREIQEGIEKSSPKKPKRAKAQKPIKAIHTNAHARPVSRDLAEYIEESQRKIGHFGSDED